MLHSLLSVERIAGHAMRTDSFVVNTMGNSQQDDTATGSIQWKLRAPSPVVRQHNEVFGVC